MSRTRQRNAAVVEPQIIPVQPPTASSRFSDPYGKRQSKSQDRFRPDLVKYDILDLETGEMIGLVIADRHSSFVKLVGVMLPSPDGTSRWRRVPSTKFTSEYDAVSALRLVQKILTQEPQGEE